jgi:putative peptide zinc metalloprotease protein
MTEGVGTVSDEEQERPQPSSTSDDRPVRADGVELIGTYEGSGYREPPLIAQRADGQVVQLSELLYSVLRNADGQKTYVNAKKKK